MVDKLPFLPDEHHYAIAAVTTRSAQLDSMIELAVAAFLSPREETSKFILKNMNGDRFVGLLRALVLDQFPDEAEQTEALFSRIGRTRTARNEIVHWLWGKSEGEIATHASVRMFRETVRKTKTAAEIAAIADDCLECVGAIHQLVDRAREDRRAASRERRERRSPQLDLGFPSEQDRPSTPGLLGLLGTPPQD